MNANSLDSLSFDQLVPSESKYLRKDDVGEDGIVVTIAGFSHADIKTDDGGVESKIIMTFKEDLPPMVVNRTNAALISVCTGAKTAGEAKGKKIVVYNDVTVSFGGRVTGGIRIKKVPGAPRPAPAAKPATLATADDFNDEIPI